MKRPASRRRLTLALLVAAVALALTALLARSPLEGPEAHGDSRASAAAPSDVALGSRRSAARPTEPTAEALTVAASAGRSEAAGPPPGHGRLVVELRAGGAPAPGVELGILGPTSDWPRTDEAGRVALDVGPGDYSVFVVRGQAGATATPAQGGAAQVDVEVQRDRTVRVTLEVQRPARLTVRWEEPRGFQPESFRVVALSDGLDVSDEPRRGERSYTWEGLEPGDYDVFVPTTDDGRRSVTLTAGEDAHISFSTGKAPVTFVLDRSGDALTPELLWYVDVYPGPERRTDRAPHRVQRIGHGARSFPCWLEPGPWCVALRCVSERPGVLQCIDEEPPREGELFEVAGPMEYTLRRTVSAPAGLAIFEGSANGLPRAEHSPRHANLFVRAMRGERTLLEGRVALAGKDPQRFRIVLDAATFRDASLELWDSPEAGGRLLDTREILAGRWDWTVDASR